MVAFFEHTWFLWWVIAVVAILRWFHVNSIDDVCEDSAEQESDGRFQAEPRQLQLFSALSYPRSDSRLPETGCPPSSHEIRSIQPALRAASPTARRYRPNVPQACGHYGSAATSEPKLGEV